MSSDVLYLSYEKSPLLTSVPLGTYGLLSFKTDCNFALFVLFYEASCECLATLFCYDDFLVVDWSFRVRLTFYYWGSVDCYAPKVSLNFEV